MPIPAVAPAFDVEDALFPPNVKVNVVLAVALGVEALLIPFDGAEDPVDVGPVAPHVHEKADGPWLAAPAEVLEVPFA